MNSPADTQPQDGDAYTPGGAKIHVRATPPFVLQNDPGTPTTGNAQSINAPATPMVINNTFEEEESPPRSNAGGPVQRQADEADDQTPRPPPATQPARRYAGTRAVDPEEAATTRTNVGARVELHANAYVGQANGTAEAAPMGPQPSHPTSSITASLVSWGSTPTRADPPSSSPLSFDWDTTPNISPSPSARVFQRAVGTLPRLHMAEASEAYLATRGEDVVLGDSTANGHGASAEANTVVGGVALGAGIGPGQTDVHAEEQEHADLFRFFCTPPSFIDPPHYQQHAIQDPRIHETNVQASQDSLAANTGEPGRPSPPDNDSLHPRKRSWLFSPDPEDLARAASRPRQDEFVPNFSEPFAGANVGREVDTGGIHGRTGSSNECNPWASARDGMGEVMPEDRRLSSLGHVQNVVPARPSITRHTSSALSTPRTDQSHAEPTRSQAVRPPRRTRTTHDSSRPDEASLQPDMDSSSRDPGLSSNGMDIDPRSTGRDSPEPEYLKKDNGKAKARAPTINGAHEDDAAIPNITRPSWDKNELIRARQESLRQTLRDRSAPQTARYSTSHLAQSRPGPSQAGPSYNGPADYYNPHDPERGYRQPQARDAHSSRWAAGLPGLDASRSVNIHEQRAERGSGYRSMSAFVPLPNTRAAQFVADRYPIASTPALTQRSPPSRLRGMQRQEAPEWRPARSPALGGEDWSFLDERREATRALSEDGAYGDDVEREREGEQENAILYDWQEDGEVLPTMLQATRQAENDVPTPVPQGGFPPLHRDDPDTVIRGAAVEWVRELWGDAPNTSVLLGIFNYRYSEDDAFNRRVAETLHWAIEQISGESNFDIVPPETEEGQNVRSRDLPVMWAARGLTPRGVERILARTVWSFNAISFRALPRATTLPSWLFALEGYLTGDVTKIRLAILRVLIEDDTRRWMEAMVAANPEYAGRQVEEVVAEIIRTLRVESIQLSNGNYINNVFM
ncbi:hypothetical protein OH76DRAFT_1488490 [Lentinus brumalis]|uniref:Uncharacterized protein n=1 Tax=Lentinus brumalis TaxID=2498619 RepID=A0A371CQY0_9APHY|nr:hypothetical protein OH76DRAFT_1488490 [Polyporus brumalis]